MDRLHTLDAEFLYLEEPRSPMHIAGICVFEAPMPSRESITQLYRAKLAQFPRYRQRVRAVPFELARPVWVDDPNFDLDYHVRFTALPHPGDERDLRTLMGRLMSQLLDRERPLWESWFVEGLEGGRWALISKIHHAMVDGVSGTSLMTALLENDPDAPVPYTPVWHPQPEPSDATLLKNALRELPGDTSAWTRTMLAQLRDPVRAGRNASDLSLGLMRMATRFRPAGTTSLQGSIGLHRSYAFARSSLDDLQLIRKAHGATLNDVVLAILAGAYRALLAHHGDDVTHAPMRSLVPVSVRHTGDPTTLDNRVAALLCDLPVHLSDPLDRLHYVSAQMSALKASHMAEASAFLTTLGDLTPPFLVGSLVRRYARNVRKSPQRTVATVTTHVPGPRNTLYFLGCRLLHYFPYVPIMQGTRVGTAVLTYHDEVAYGVTADPEHVPDIDLFTHTIGEDTKSLVQRSLASTPVHPTAADAVSTAVPPVPPDASSHDAPP